MNVWINGRLLPLPGLVPLHFLLFFFYWGYGKPFKIRYKNSGWCLLSSASHSTIPISPNLVFFFFFFSFIFISWRLITLQYCSGFCHTLTWISHGFTCIPHSNPPSHLSLYPIPLGFPSAPGRSTCLMHPTWAGDLFHPRKVTLVVKMSRSHLTHPFTLPLQTQVQSLNKWGLVKTHERPAIEASSGQGQKRRVQEGWKKPLPIQGAFLEVGNSRRGGQQSTTGGYTPGITQEHQSGVGWQ